MAKLLVGSLVLLLIACGGSRPKPTTVGTTASAPPPPPPWEVTTATGGNTINAIAADDAHVYWAGSGIHRRAHGGATAEETVLDGVAHGEIYDLTIGDADVFAIDASGRLLAVAKAGGEPADLGEAAGVWAMAADGDGVWLGVEDRLERRSRSSGSRTIQLHATGTRLAVAGGRAIATLLGGADSLVAIDLASGALTALSQDYAFADATSLAISGKSAVAATYDGVIAMPLTGGRPRRSLSTRVQFVGGDDRGYVAITASALIDQARGEPPRVIATSTFASSITDASLLALGGDYAYHLATAISNGAVTLRGTPRQGGATLLRLPADAYLSALAVSGDTVYAGLDGVDGSRLVTVGTDGVSTVAKAPGSISTIVADGTDVAFYADYRLHVVDRATHTAQVVSDQVDSVPLALRKGIVYWASGTLIRGVKLDGGRVFTLADVTRFDERVDPGTFVQSVVFAADRLYLVLPYGQLVGVARIDERRSVDMAWTRSTDGGSSLDPFLATDGDAIYVHDGTQVFRIPLGDGETTTVREDAYSPVLALYGVDGAAVARINQRDGGEALVALREGAGTRPIWWASLDGGAMGLTVAGAHAIYSHSYELGGILRIEPAAQKDQPSASP